MSKADIRVDLREFKPVEVETITGLSTTMQRDWRYRDFLPERPTGKTHSRFNIYDVAEMLIMKRFSDRGVGPSLTKTLAHGCAVNVVGHCIWVNSDEGVGGWEGLGVSLGLDLENLKDGEELSRRVNAAALGEKDVDPPWRFFVWGADDQHFYFDSAEAIFEEMGGWTVDGDRATGRRFGVLLILDLLDAADALWAGLKANGDPVFVRVEAK